MRTPTSLPYLTPSDEHIKDHPWTDGDGIELADRLDHWDPFSELAIYRTLDLDLDAIRAECRLRSDALFALVPSWTSSHTRLGSAGSPVELGRLGGQVRTPLTLSVPGSASGGRLRLRTSLIVRNAGTDPSAISPTRAGTILWYDERSIALEGSASRFPISALDFASRPGTPEGGSWILEWHSDDFATPVLADLRLLVNSSNETLLAALRSGASDPRSAAVRQFVTFDVARSLVHGALDNEDFVERPEEYEEGTIGRMLSEMLGLYWPGVPVATLRTRLREQPQRLDAELQAALGLFR
jgi:hypothetical protein